MWHRCNRFNHQTGSAVEPAAIWVKVPGFCGAMEERERERERERGREREVEGDLEERRA